MPEKFIPQEALQGDLAEQLEQAIEQAPDIPTDREKLFKSLSAKKAAMLAALLTVTGLASEVSAEEAFYDKPANVKVEELPKSQRGDKSTMYLYGHQLEDFSNKLEDTDPNTTTAGETGQATIKHLVRMISFCEHAGSKLEDVYDLSSIPNNSKLI